MRWAATRPFWINDCRFPQGQSGSRATLAARMLATATHDTKRGEDMRARLAALSEFAEEWVQQLPVWSRILRGPVMAEESDLKPDRNDEYLLFQLLLGAWPCELLEPGALDEQALQAILPNACAPPW
jgi:(1->4)-alpha-D-glucan 1-alpha-D-glucosylmutase